MTSPLSTTIPSDAPKTQTTFARYASGVGFWAAATALTAGMHATAGTQPIAAFLLALTLTGWYAGAGPAVLVLVLSVIADRALPAIFGPPVVLTPVARDAYFAVFCVGAAYFGVVRRRMEEELWNARTRLEEQVSARTAELRQKERYLDEAQRLSQTGCWAYSVAGMRLLWWSDQANRIYGMDTVDPPANLNFVRALIHPDDNAPTQAITYPAMREGRPFDVEYRIVRPDGAVRRIRSVGRPSPGTAGAPDEYLGVVMDITERREEEQALQRVREGAMQARFAARLEERTRLAREMHDTLLQGFTGVALKLAAATERMDASATEVGELRSVIGLAQRTLADARRAIWDMRLPSAGTVADALRADAEEVVRSTGITLAFSTRGEPRERDTEAEDALLKVGREAVLNAVRHSGGSRIDVQLGLRLRCLCLMVSDDGRGFVVDPGLRSYGGHWGLLGMRERAAHAGGRLTIRSAPDRGTRVVLLLPYTGDAAGPPI